MRGCKGACTGALSADGRGDGSCAIFFSSSGRSVRGSGLTSARSPRTRAHDAAQAPPLYVLGYKTFARGPFPERCGAPGIADVWPSRCRTDRPLTQPDSGPNLNRRSAHDQEADRGPRRGKGGGQRARAREEEALAMAGWHADHRELWCHATTAGNTKRGARGSDAA